MMKKISKSYTKILATHSIAIDYLSYVRESNIEGRKSLSRLFNSTRCYGQLAFRPFCEHIKVYACMCASG